MVLLKDIEVKVALRSTIRKSPGEALKEYPNPASPTSSDEWLAERYIEAKPGQEFQIEIYLKPSFKLFAADQLSANLIIDDYTVNFCMYYTKQYVATNISSGKPFVIYYVLSTDGKQYSKVSFSFGSLSLDDTIDIDNDIATKQAEKMGRISVEVSRVRRARAKKSRRPRIKGLNFYKPLASTTYPKEVFKDRHIRQAMVPGSHTPTPTEKLVRDDEYVPYSAQGCQPARFVFRYRDELGLQQLGCIPKDEGPPPSEIPSLGSPDSQRDGEHVVVDLDNSEEDEITTLRTEVEQLRSNSNEHREVKRKFEEMAQEFTVVKQMNERIATMFENFTNGASSPSIVPGLVAMTGNSGTRSGSLSGPTTTKTEKSLKEEEDVATTSQSSASRRPGAKRQKVVIELD